MRRRRLIVKAIEIGEGHTKYVRLPRKDSVLKQLSRFLFYEVSVEQDPADPHNPLAYRIVFKPIRERELESREGA